MRPTPPRSEADTLASQLIEARSRAGLTQAEVAERMGTSQSTVARLESGTAKPSLSTLRRFAETRPRLRATFITLSVPCDDSPQPLFRRDEVWANTDGDVWDLSLPLALGPVASPLRQTLSDVGLQDGRA